MGEPCHTVLYMVTRAWKLKALECTLRPGYPIQCLSFLHEDLGWPPPGQDDIGNSTPNG
jgi:hypothetical protein